jgi:cellulose synthase operon protein C
LLRSELGGVLYLEGEDKRAQQALERAIALDPHDTTAQYRLGLEYLQNGQPHRAVGCFRNALHGGANDRAILYNLALGLRRSGQAAEAKRVEEMLSKQLQNTSKVDARGLAIGNLVDAGIALEKSGKIRAAMERYRAALDLDPMDAILRLDYGLAVCRLGEWQQGAAELREVLRLDPNNVAAAKALYVALEEIQKDTGKRPPDRPVGPHQ